MSNVYLQDSRPDGDPSLAVLPRQPSAEALIAAWGLTIDESQGWAATPAGKGCWQLIGVDLVTGPAQVSVLVIGATGIPAPNIRVVETWPGNAKALPPEVRPRYTETGEVGVTNNNGIVGFPYGEVKDSGIVPGAGGPFEAWVCASPVGLEPQYSDRVKGLGQWPGTPHLTLNLIFALVTKPVVVPVPPPVPPPVPVPVPVPTPTPVPPLPPVPGGVGELINNLLGSRKWVIGIVILAILAVLTYTGTFTKAEFTDLLKWIVGILFSASAVQDGVGYLARAQEKRAYYDAVGTVADAQIYAASAERKAVLRG